MKISVFISYAKEDWSFVERIYKDLLANGVEPWLDRFNLIPGQIWDKEIVKAIEKCSYFLAILSKRSVDRKGYVQKEIRKALAVADEYPEGEVFIIPVRIDECEPSFDGLRRIHRADLFPEYEPGFRELLRVFNYKYTEKPELVES